MDTKSVYELERLVAWAHRKASEALARWGELDQQHSGGSYSRAARKGECKSIALDEQRHFLRLADAYRRQLPPEHPQHLAAAWRPLRGRGWRRVTQAPRAAKYDR